MNLDSFHKLIGQYGDYVYCKNKKRINNLKYTYEEAEDWLVVDKTCKLGWWIGEDYIVLDFDDMNQAKQLMNVLKLKNIKGDVNENK
mgnify:FL=1